MPEISGASLLLNSKQMASDFQFVGITEVLTAFENRELDLWALFAGKRLIVKGEGVDELGSFLEMISRSQTTSVYTLKLYEGVSKDQIKSTTPDDGSFNFKLFSPDYGTMSGLIRKQFGDPVQEKILQRLDDMEARINGVDDEEPSFGKQMSDAFIGMISDPNRLGQFLEVIKPIFGGPQIAPIRAGVGNINPGMAQQTGGGVELTPENLQRIGDAIEKIATVDNKIVEHLEKLALMAEKTPGKLKGIVAILDTSF